jgi:hypothetical protein
VRHACGEEAVSGEQEDSLRLSDERALPLRAFKWLRSVIAVLIMVYAVAFGLTAVGGGLVHLPDTIRRGDLSLVLGGVLVATMCTALFSVGAGLWIQGNPSHPATAAAWRRTFRIACGFAIGLMLLILTVSIVARV